MTESIQEYSSTEAALADLRDRYQGASYDVTSPGGMTEAKKGRAEIRSWRTGLDKERKKIKAPALDRCRAIDAEAKRITAELMTLEDPIDSAIRSEEQRAAKEHAAAERAKADRVAGIAKRIDAFERAPLALVGKPAHEIATAIEWLNRNEPASADFDAQLDAASSMHGDALAKLQSMHATAIAEADQRAELVRMKTEQAEREADERKRVAAEAKAIAEAEAESRRKIEEQERASRERIEAAEREAREKRQIEDRKRQAETDAIEARDREQKAEAEAKAKAERDAAEAAEREARRAAAEISDAREMLTLFVTRYGDIAEFNKIASKIATFLGE
jgi:hypothetical protein